MKQQQAGRSAGRSTGRSTGRRTGCLGPGYGSNGLGVGRCSVASMVGACSPTLSDLWWPGAFIGTGELQHNPTAQLQHTTHPTSNISAVTGCISESLAVQRRWTKGCARSGCSTALCAERMWVYGQMHAVDTFDSSCSSCSDWWRLLAANERGLTAA